MIHRKKNSLLLLVFSIFWDTVSIANIIPIEGTRALKTDYILNFNNFLITRSILYLNVSLDRAHQDHKLYLKTRFLEVMPRTLDFFVCVKFHDFSIVCSLFWDTVSITSILPTGEPIRGIPASKKLIICWISITF